MKKFLRKHKLAIILAILVGAIMIAPQLYFIYRLGGEYRGVYMINTANELEYLARTREVLDGHPTLGSVPFFEYKDAPGVMPPTFLDLAFAGLSRLFGWSLSTIFIGAKFFLPALLSFLVYFFTLGLLRRDVHADRARQWHISLAATAISMFVMLGYDLIDFRGVLDYLRGLSSPSDFLLWSRPMNPIFGGILIFSFLIAAWRLWTERGGLREQIAIALALLLAITSYYFSWGMILALTAALSCAAVLTGRYVFLRRLLFGVGGGLLFATPYFVNLRSAMQDPEYLTTALRTGLFIDREPIVNKLLVAALAVFVLLTVVIYRRRRAESTSQNYPWREEWWSFALAMLGAGFIAFNVQVVLGKTVWPFHFVQYTIPFAMIAISVAIYNFWPQRARNARVVFFGAIMLVALAFGVFTQISAYQRNFSDDRALQKYATVFDWLNVHGGKECVVLTTDRVFLSRAVTVFTACDSYISDYGSFLLPLERLKYNYLLWMRLSGVNEKNLDEFLQKNSEDYLVYLYATEPMAKRLAPEKAAAALVELRSRYLDFIRHDLKTEIAAYRSDFAVTEKGSSAERLLGAEFNTIFINENFVIFETR